MKNAYNYDGILKYYKGKIVCAMAFSVNTQHTILPHKVLKIRSLLLQTDKKQNITIECFLIFLESFIKV